MNRGPWAPLEGGMLWPALKFRMRVLLARLLGYQRPRLPRAINCRHLRFEQDGSPRWVETEADMPPNGLVFVPIWYCAHIVTTPRDEKMTLAPLSTFCFTYRAAEVQLRRFAPIFPTAAVQATSLVFDAADPDHRWQLEECRRNAVKEALRYG